MVWSRFSCIKLFTQIGTSVNWWKSKVNVNNLLHLEVMCESNGMFNKTAITNISYLCHIDISVWLKVFVTQSEWLIYITVVCCVQSLFILGQKVLLNSIFAFKFHQFYYINSKRYCQMGDDKRLLPGWKADGALYCDQSFYEWIDYTHNQIKGRKCLKSFLTMSEWYSILQIWKHFFSHFHFH